MKRRRRLHLFPPQLRPELQLSSERSETRSSDTQVAAPLSEAVWGAEAVVAVVAVAAAVDMEAAVAV